MNIEARTHSTGARRAHVGALAAFLTTLVLGIVVPPAFAVEAVQSERQLDAQLSLTGGCAAPEALDPVADPGTCPMPPGVPGVDHPGKAFATPMAVATDAYGNIYVSNFGQKNDGTEGRIDIFSPQGVFIGEVVPPYGPTAITVDGTGALYTVVEKKDAIPNQLPILRYIPSEYEPAAGKVVYGNPPVAIPIGENAASTSTGIAVNPANDHLFANFGSGGTVEYKSAADAEPNGVVRTTAEGSGVGYGAGVAVDASRHRLYSSYKEEQINIYDLNQITGSNEYEKIGEIPGSAIPEGSFGNYLSVAVDEATGHVFVLDGENNKLYEFDEDGNYVSTLEHGFNVTQGAEIAIDNGANSPNGALNDLPGGSGRYLFVPSGKTGTGHSFAFNEPQTRKPEVKSVAASGIGTGEAELQATVNPGGLATTYTVEYLTRQAWEEAGNSFAGASLAGSGQLSASGFDGEAFAVASGLQAGPEYRFRVLATDAKGADEAEGSFATYPSNPVEPTPCANASTRSGLSALLADCRAYELVTPGDTNARAPVGTGPFETFTNRQISPAGDKLPFRVTGGAIPGIGGTGGAVVFDGDSYLASRTPTGWSTAYTGPSGAESEAPLLGGTSPDQGYSFWLAQQAGSALVEGKSAAYVRYPDGHSELLGKGSIGTDLEAGGLLISENGAHIVFASGNGVSTSKAVQLEPGAAPSHTEALYDRTPDGTVHVISLKPGDLPFGASEDAGYQGASLDGRGVAFKVGSKLYLRYEDSASYEIGEGVQFAGVAEGGNRIFYVEGGRLWRFDAADESRVAFSAGTVTPVIVSPDGSAAYFVSTSALTTKKNPNGAKAKAGQRNLYLSREGAIGFLGTVTERDVVDPGKGGLGLWVGAASSGNLAIDPARAATDGSTLLFESEADLAGYDPEEHAEVYRYDSTEETLRCLSCNPTGSAAASDASLQSEQREGHVLFYPRAWLANLRADGRRAFFQSSEALVPADADGRQDVYEWEAQGVGSCSSPGGCLYLISSGQSARNEYLWAVSQSGEDVFFLSSDLLVGSDAEDTPSVYDARVGGGFPEPQVAGECLGEACQPSVKAPAAVSPASAAFHGAGNVAVSPGKVRCGKGRRAVRRHGKARCVKKHHRRQGAAKGKGGRR